MDILFLVLLFPITRPKSFFLYLDGFLKINIKNIKKNTDFKISIDIDNKIPRPDFIEMMEDSYEVSIIDYLAKEFTKNIISDTSMIENKIKDAIKNIVYKKEEKAEDPIVKKEDKTPSTKPRRKKLNNSTESLKNKTE